MCQSTRAMATTLSVSVPRATKRSAELLAILNRAQRFRFTWTKCTAISTTLFFHDDSSFSLLRSRSAPSLAPGTCLGLSSREEDRIES